LSISHKIIFVVAGGFLLLSGCAGVPVSPSGVPSGLESSLLTVEGKNFVPADALSQILNARLDWDKETFTFAMTQEHNVARVSVNSPIISINGMTYALRDPVMLYEGRVLLPAELFPLLQSRNWVFKGVPPKACAVYKIKKIVLDPGHGGKDPGALGRLGIKEKDIVLDVAKRVKSILQRKGFDVAMTRDTDIFISLEERTRIAHAQNADLFVSIHANAAPTRSLKGFEVYYISEKMDDETRASASADNLKLELEGSAFQYHSKNLDSILWDLLYNEYRKESIQLAEYVSREVEKDNLSSRRTSRIKGALFYVLKGTGMPAILIEIGYISNSIDAAKIKDPEYRQRLAEAIARGIAEFREEFQTTGGFCR